MGANGSMLLDYGIDSSILFFSWLLAKLLTSATKSEAASRMPSLIGNVILAGLEECST